MPSVPGLMISPGSSASSPCCRFWTCAPTVSVWLLTGCAWYCERLGELGPAVGTEASHSLSWQALRDLVNSTKNIALVHIACLENQGLLDQCGASFSQSDRGPQQSNQSDTERQAGSVYFIGEEYSYDSVGTVRPPASLIVPLGPRLHHAGRNHEPDGGDSATGGTADDDQEGADSGRRPLSSIQGACWLCRDTYCLEKAWTPSWLHIAATGKLTSFARMFIKLNEFLKHFSGEGCDRSMSTSLSASQLHTVNMRDPLNHVLANLLLLISSVLGSKTAGPHTQFVQSFMKECVECLEKGSCGSIL
ncbi:mediator of RNA polymerase II transcription subunit 24-like isoform X2 [Oncorhynchus kisutch]|uniref:mediator of RNA polymerase II transcription subunit 24-like isoform X2 n=1 Tax=Oncorhynchus kisutch TaxID=8019 RepID=UPI00099F6850|nr:mediator of RNA polymerase II transcription subunit 24-like isoform X2 [Oncorhynchus kisutch]